MIINFDVKFNTTYYFQVMAEIKVKGRGTIYINKDDYNAIPEDLSKEEFINWIYDTYLYDMGYYEDNTTFDESDLELAYKTYLKING